MSNQYRRKRIPYGFVFSDIEETRRFKEISYQAEKILNMNDYKPVMPSTIDFQDTFEIFGREDIFHLKDHLGDRLALRNDVTVQIIKGFCNQLEREHIQPKVSKYYYNVPIFTDIRKNYPSLREVQQLGAEIIGADSEDAIFELILMIDKIFKEVFSISYRLILSDVRVFECIQKEFSSQDLHKTIFRRDLPSLTDLIIEAGWKKEEAFSFARNILYFKEESELERSLVGLKEALTTEQKAFVDLVRDALVPLINLKQKVKQKDIPIDIEPLLLRRPKYYTGFLFEGYISGLSFPPLRGGSYDCLVAEYSNQNYPASGFALDISSMI